jgi:hypothetical protein
MERRREREAAATRQSLRAGKKERGDILPDIASTRA